MIRHLASKPKQRIGSMLINPGGPGDTGLGLVRGGGADLDRMGRWPVRRRQLGSPRHKCQHPRSMLHHKRKEATFWKGVSIPISTAASKRYARKVAELAARCKKVSGWLSAHLDC